jgi:hypothetical protein
MYREHHTKSALMPSSKAVRAGPSPDRAGGRKYLLGPRHAYEWALMLVLALAAGQSFKSIPRSSSITAPEIERRNTSPRRL